jgi:high-affinity K+ transport system ATPase subunit B
MVADDSVAAPSAVAGLVPAIEVSYLRRVDDAAILAQSRRSLPAW